MQGGLVEAKTDVAVKDGQDRDFQEDHGVEGSEDHCDPLVRASEGQHEPDGNTDATTGMYDNSYEKPDENRVIFLADAIVDEGAVMVEFLDAPLAVVTVVAAFGHFALT